MKYIITIFIFNLFSINLYADYDPFEFNQFYNFKADNKKIKKKQQINKKVKRNKIKNTKYQTVKVKKAYIPIIPVVKNNQKIKKTKKNRVKLPKRTYKKIIIDVRNYKRKKRNNSKSVTYKIEPSEKYKKMMRDWEKNKYNYFR
jgi:hypothetical protein